MMKYTRFALLGTAALLGACTVMPQGPSVTDLQAKIGQLPMENDFLERALDRVHGPSAKR